MKDFNTEMSRKYGVKVYNFENPNFPFWVEGLFEDAFEPPLGCTESEIKGFVDYHHETDEVSPWACEIIGWYESVKDDPERYPELEDIIDEINWYLETMHGVKLMNEYPEWLRDYLYDIDENFGVSYDVWIPIIDRVIPHLA
jgi:hypothetical protein